MKTTADERKEWRKSLQEGLDDGGITEPKQAEVECMDYTETLDAFTSMTADSVFRLLDDADELERLQEALEMIRRSTPDCTTGAFSPGELRMMHAMAAKHRYVTISGVRLRVLVEQAMRAEKEAEVIEDE